MPSTCQRERRWISWMKSLGRDTGPRAGSLVGGAVAGCSSTVAIRRYPWPRRVWITRCCEPVSPRALRISLSAVERAPSLTAVSDHTRSSSSSLEMTRSRFRSRYRSRRRGVAWSSTGRPSLRSSRRASSASKSPNAKTTGRSSMGLPMQLARLSHIHVAFRPGFDSEVRRVAERVEVFTLPLLHSPLAWMYPRRGTRRKRC